MKSHAGVFGVLIPAAILFITPALSASNPHLRELPADFVITVVPDANGSASVLEPGELTVLVGRSRARVVQLRHLTADAAGMQLFILLDDSTRSSSLALHFSELRDFLNSLPPATEVAIGYMRNGAFALAQPFTTDHQKASATLRLPQAVPGVNGSPYFAVSDLIDHWPSKETTGRRAVLMLTDGVDRYFGPSVEDDPYADAASRNAAKHGVMIYSIFLRGTGFYGRGSWATNMAQSRLSQLGDETGGYAYFEDFTDPVTIVPFLRDLQLRFENQYDVTIAASGSGLQPVKLHTEIPNLKVSGPAEIYVP
jgi:hypothetical protein